MSSFFFLLLAIQLIFYIYIYIYFLQTLCNACGIQYLKIVKGTGSGLPAAVADDEGDASPGPVPAAEIVEEGDSNL